jgi:hypothetical protein
MGPSGATCLPADCFRISVNYYYKNPFQRVGLVQSGHHDHFTECNLFSPWYSWKIAELALSNNGSITHLVKSHISCHLSKFKFQPSFTYYPSFTNPSYFNIDWLLLLNVQNGKCHYFARHVVSVVIILFSHKEVTEDASIVLHMTQEYYGIF